MALIGIQIDRTNPPFTAADFTFWQPQYTNFLATENGQTYFNKIYGIVNQKIFKSIFGSDWELAMSYAIAHYLTLISQEIQAPSGNTLQGIVGGQNRGVLASANIGGFSKSYSLDYTMISDAETKFWNQTKYGANLMALLRTKPIPSIMVVTTHPLAGAN